MARTISQAIAMLDAQKAKAPENQRAAISLVATLLERAKGKGLETVGSWEEVGVLAADNAEFAALTADSQAKFGFPGGLAQRMLARLIG